MRRLWGSAIKKYSPFGFFFALGTICEMQHSVNAQMKCSMCRKILIFPTFSSKVNKQHQKIIQSNVLKISCQVKSDYLLIPTH